MFHFLEYPFSRGFVHIKSKDPYESPDFDPGFMNDERDMAPMVWGYIKSRETARRMDAYAGEVQAMHPFFDYDSPARANDMDLETTQRYALPGNLSAGLRGRKQTAGRCYQSEDDHYEGGYRALHRLDCFHEARRPAKFRVRASCSGDIVGARWARTRTSWHASTKLSYSKSLRQLAMTLSWLS